MNMNHDMARAPYEHDSVIPRLQDLTSMLCVVCMSWLLLHLLIPYAAPDMLDMLVQSLPTSIKI